MSLPVAVLCCAVPWRCRCSAKVVRCRRGAGVRLAGVTLVVDIAVMSSWCHDIIMTSP